MRAVRSLWWILPGAGVAAIATALAVTADTPSWERAVARAVFDLPVVLTAPLEVVMQAGTRGAVAVLAIMALAMRRTRLAMAVLLGGACAWALATLAKNAVGRPRPTTELLAREVRELIASPGYPSSHAAIAAALAVAVVLSGDFPRAVPLTALAVAATTALARVHLGVHWPLDVIGGAAIGVVCAGLTHLVVSRPRRA